MLRTQTASVISTLEPVYGIALAALILGEVPTLRSLVGGAVVLGTAGPIGGERHRVETSETHTSAFLHTVGRGGRHG